MSDVTELKVAEQEHADLLRELVGKLSDAVALHDPYSAHHASRMAEVAQAVGRELGLPEEERETLGLAATLPTTLRLDAIRAAQAGLISDMTALSDILYA